MASFFLNMYVLSGLGKRLVFRHRICPDVFYFHVADVLEALDFFGTGYT